MIAVHPRHSALSWHGTSRHRFTVNVSFPVSFTSSAWDPGNTALVDAFTQREPRRRHRLVVVADNNVVKTNPDLPVAIGRYVERWGQRLELAGPVVTMPGGETAKNSLRSVKRLLQLMDDQRIDRQSFLVVIGGGAVLDAASFAAAICHRGVRVVRMPSTVLAQCDSGIAVKNGVNMFGKKNFVGTFVPPFAVVNDVALLRTLTSRDLRSGLSEIVKVAALRDPALFSFLEEHHAELHDPASEALAYVVRRSAERHLEHICGSGDPFELGSARPLDFGHWAAHKLESLTRHRVRHGEAVAIGMALDMLYAVRIGVAPAAVAERLLRLLERLGFTLWDEALTGHAGAHSLFGGLQEFREHLGGQLHVTLLRAIDDAFEVTEIDSSLMLQALADLAARYARTASAR